MTGEKVRYREGQMTASHGFYKSDHIEYVLRAADTAYSETRMRNRCKYSADRAIFLRL